ncbi:MULTISPECIES: hypothetical protein [Sphingobacterium]|uniref:Uncharacterized protein n=1 Tax=Sphingobacterium zeae TaxID=1776859 RepID=A0ABU0U2V8_9SPHI|nr:MULTISPECIES: hypothetical protein [Sphingobacterium]MDQ1149275.1 hypothetical protein [Sphingobacterium zeae]
MSNNSVLKNSSNLGKVNKKDNTIADQKIKNDEKLVNLIVKILVNKAIKEANEKGYTLFKVQQ